MVNNPDKFYVIRGTLKTNDRSYITRSADEELFNNLKEGKFCYVLTSRQMGKSSLMVRTAMRLREEGVAVADVDLSGIGRNMTPEQWYEGMLVRIGRRLGFEEELEDYWDEHEHLGPLQRWMQALQEVVLVREPRRVVIFVDEIDFVRSLPFPTDEFFAGIRACYNQRAQDPELNRLTFCLLGVATPTDLIQNVHTTPFNIGKCVVLTDFDGREAAPLIEGFGRSVVTGSRLLRRVLYWTGGHPYLTQRLCQAVAQDESVHGPEGVDRLVDELFLLPSARERDENLIFVRDRILRGESDLAALLTLYRDVWEGKNVPADEEAGPLISTLLLSGITRVRDGRLEVRNQIYRHVFDREWVRENMPDAEVRRQRAAYRKGVIRATSTTALFVVLAVVFVTMAFSSVRSHMQAVEAGYRYEALRREIERLREENHALKLGYEGEIRQERRRAQDMQIALEETKAQFLDTTSRTPKAKAKGR